MQRKDIFKLIQFGGVAFVFFVWPFVRGLLQAKRGQDMHRRKRAARGQGKKQRKFTSPPSPVVRQSKPAPRSMPLPAPIWPTPQASSPPASQRIDQAPDVQPALLPQYNAEFKPYSPPVYAGPSAEYENLEGGLRSELDGGFHHHVSAPEQDIAVHKRVVQLDRNAILAAVVLGEAGLLQRHGHRSGRRRGRPLSR